jgi:ABC-type Na+ efflux pump permease subunit
MTLVARRTFLLAVGVHAILVFDALGQAARCVAVEQERRTLEFLLATSLSSAEIILGKFAARVIGFLGTLAAGVPFMVLLNRLGGVDARLILLAYAAIMSTSLFLAALGIWVSTVSTESRRAIGLAMLLACFWLWIPFSSNFILPRFGVRLPAWVLAANALCLQSSPMGLLLKAPGLAASSALVDAVLQMCGLQLLGGLVCLLAAVIQLRPACRARAGQVSADDSRIPWRWRFRTRPAVGDDPILWREMNTCRPRGLARLADLLVYTIIACAIAYPTWYFGRLAVIELWHYGYSSISTSAKAPEFNLIMRFFVQNSYDAIDQARVEFNLLMRLFTVGLGFFIVFAALAFGVEGIVAEQKRDTWSSLLATPLEGRDILRAKLLGTLWRFRLGVGTLVLLWLLDLLTGSLHPLGMVLAMLGLMSWLLFASLWAMQGAIAARDATQASNSNGIRSLLVMLINATSVLPFFLPSGLNSVLWGSCSPVFVLWLTQFSCRDLRLLSTHASYPPLHWARIETGEGAIAVALTCLVGIVAPLIGGLAAWRYVTRHFDRLVGRPWRAEDRLPLPPRLLADYPDGN